MTPPAGDDRVDSGRMGDGRPSREEFMRDIPKQGGSILDEKRADQAAGVSPATGATRGMQDAKAVGDA